MVLADFHRRGSTRALEMTEGGPPCREPVSPETKLRHAESQAAMAYDRRMKENTTYTVMAVLALIEQPRAYPESIIDCSEIASRTGLSSTDLLLVVNAKLKLFKLSQLDDAPYHYSFSRRAE
jgi:hypothetical protein